jgi:hypothetical protein
VRCDAANCAILGPANALVLANREDRKGWELA